MNTQPINAHSLNRRIRRRHLFGAAFRAGFIGGLIISFLLVLYQISPPFLQLVLVPAVMVIVWVVTGIAAAMLAGNYVLTSQEGRRIGIIAGLISGTVTGIAAMIIAAFGTTFQGTGQGVLAQFSDTQLTSLLEAGITEQLIVLFGSILSAMFTCGIGGMFVAALLGGFGGWLFPKLGD